MLSQTKGQVKGQIKKIGVGLLLGCWAFFSPRAIAAPVCSPVLTDVLPQMLVDLPSYGNRVIQRSRRLDREQDSFSYVLVANHGEFLPIILGNQQFTPTVPNTTEQFFFTTLEKQYLSDRSVTYEKYYWLFVTPTDEGWALVHLFSSIGSIDPVLLPIPPRDATDSIIGTATKLWLRDYNAHCVD
jgi:hypothetical protein